METRSESRSEQGEYGPTTVGLATRRQTPRPADLPAGGDAAASAGVEAGEARGGAYQPAGYRKRCPARWSAIFDLTTGRVSWVSRIENVGT